MMENEQLLTAEQINEVFETIESNPIYYQNNQDYDELKFEGYTVDVFVSVSASTN